MAFPVIRSGLIALISSKCWVDDQFRRKQRARQFQEDYEATAMERYEEFEATAQHMITALTPSPDERNKQISQFYKDHPPPSAPQNVGGTRLLSVKPRSPWRGLFPLFSYQFSLVTISGIVPIGWASLLKVPARVRDIC